MRRGILGARPRNLAQVERASATTRRTARGEEGRVVVGFTSSAPFHPFVPRAIRAFREMSPHVSLVLEESGSGELVQALHSDEIDAAFIRSPIADVVGLEVTPLLEEEMVAALPTGHQFATSNSDTKRLPLSALAKEIFVLYKRPGGPGLYDTIITACKGAGFSPRVGQEAPRILSTLNLVAAGLGVSIVPASLRRLEMDGVVYRSIVKNQQPLAPLILACRGTENSATVRRFIELVKQTAKS